MTTTTTKTRMTLGSLALSILTLGTVACGQVEEPAALAPTPVMVTEVAHAEQPAQSDLTLEQVIADAEERKELNAQRQAEALVKLEEAEVRVEGIRRDLQAMGYLSNVSSKDDATTARALYDLGYDTGRTFTSTNAEVAAAVSTLRAAGHTNPPTPPGEVAVKSTEAYTEAREAILSGKRDDEPGTFTTKIIGQGGTDLLDQCRGAIERVWEDGPYTRPYILEHNGCGGEGALDVPVGGTITFAEGGLYEGTYVVVDEIDILKPSFGDSKMGEFDALAGDLIYQTCYELPSPMMRGMGLVPEDQAHRYGF